MKNPKDLLEYVATLPEYLSWIELCYNIFQPERCKLLFRGHAAEGWALTPSAFRKKRFSERNAIMDYIQVHSASANYLANIDGILLEMHRQGLATRLLEWWVSPLNALYHACMSGTETDGMVFCLNPRIDAEQHCFAVSEDVYGEELMQHARMCLALGWTVSETIEYVARRFGCVLKKEDLENPIPFVASVGDDKKKYFILWGSEKSDFRDVPSFRDNILEVRIRKEDKKELVLGLERLGISM